MLTNIGETPMIQSGNEGLFGGGGGLFGGFLLGALLTQNGGIFGNRNGNEMATAGLANNISDIRSDIYANQLSEVTNTLNQTNALNAQFANMAMQNCNSTYAINNSIKDSAYSLNDAIKDCCCNTQLGIAGVNTNIVKSDYENQIRTLEATNKLSGEIAAAFCKVDNDVKESAYQTQLRDLQNQAATDAKLAAIQVGQQGILASIDSHSKENTIDHLKEKIDDLQKRHCHYPYYPYPFIGNDKPGNDK